MSAEAEAKYTTYEAKGRNAFLLPKLAFAERPVTVTTEYWDGTTTVVSADQVKRDLISKLVAKMSMQEIHDLARLTDESRAPSREIAAASR